MSQQQESLFSSLTPEVLPKEKLEIYYDAFEYAFSSPEVKNLAITGTYGSGKSTIIRSIQNNFQSFHFLNVSMASFNDDELKKRRNSSFSSENGKDELERLLELSILQQIFYHVKPSEIPDSRFKRIKSITKDDLVFFSLQAIIWLISILFIFLPKQIPFINNFKNIEILRTVAFIVFFWGIWYLIIHLRRVYNNSKVNKLNIQSGEFELDKEVEQSILNKNIDEIIYFFEITKFNVVVFEDLDRFDNKEIFSKLREINLLLNNSKQVGKKVIFIYAIRDDLFEDESRTKFFDFIIPVIPFINYSNSKEILGRSIDNMSIEHKPSKKFIKEISVYIHDMRFLKNVLNEYRIYENKIGSNLNQDKLLSLIFFKNFYPEHFANIHDNNGVLNRIFMKRNHFIREKVQLLRNQIDEIGGELEKIEINRPKDQQTLWLQYVDEIRKQLKLSLGLIVKGHSFIEYSDLYDCSNEIQKLIIESDDLEGRFIQNLDTYPIYLKNQKSGVSFRDIEKLVNPNFSFLKRIDLISGAIKEKHYEEIRDKENIINKIKFDEFSNIVENIDLKDFLKDISNSKPLIFLIRNGYIDEHFMSYVSYFHPYSLKQQDNDFLEAVYSDMNLGFNHPLQNTINLIETIDIRHFNFNRIFNFTLLTQLIESKNNESSKFKVYMDKLSDGSTASYEFILAYIDHSFNPAFIEILVDKWKGLWKYIERDTKLTKEKKTDLLTKIIQFGETQAVFELSVNSNLKPFLEDHKDILTLMDNPDTSQKFINIVSKLGVKFSSIDPSISKSNSLLSFVYNEELYELNDHMIKIILEKLSTYKLDSESLITYSVIFGSNMDKLQEYSKRNINNLLRSIIHSGSKIEEEQDALIDILNNSELEISVLKLYLESLNTNVLYLNKIIDKKVKLILLAKNKMEATWENVDNVYNELESKLSEDLINYLNDEVNSNELSNQHGIKFDRKISLYSSILVCNELSFESYKNLVTGLNDSPWNSMDLTNLEEERVKWLIDEKVLSLSEENFVHLKENFYPENIHLLEHHRDDFKNFIFYEIDSNDLTKIIFSKILKDEVKVEFINIHKELLKELDTKTLFKILGYINLSGEYIILNPEEIAVFFQNLDFKTHETELIQLFNQNAILINEQEVKKLIGLFPMEYKKLLTPAKRLTLEKISPFIEFSKIMESNSITTRKLKTDKIILTGKYR